jgi:CheY-like chemotaxis protein
MLEELSYQVTTIRDGLKAIKHFAADPDRFDLAITDQAMPSIVGLELAKQLRGVRPEVLSALGRSSATAGEELQG